MCSCCLACGSRCSYHYENGDKQNCTCRTVEVSGLGIVDTIAKVLRGHAFTEIEHGYWYCECGADLGVLLPDDLHAEHQARAVLAALTEAGTVEWATEHFDVGRNTWEMHPWPNEEGARRVGKARCARVVSRLTLPWTAVE